MSIDFTKGFIPRRAEDVPKYLEELGARLEEAFNTANEDIAAGGGGGSALEIEAEGISISTAATKLNFVGFNVTEPVADEITITYSGAAAGDGTYSPGYNYSQYSSTAFTVDLFDASSLFRIGRRIKIGSGGVYVYGVVNAVDFNSTAANDTYVSLAMEGGDTVPVTIEELYLVSSVTSWVPIAEDPFGGASIRAIATGAIAGTQWWVIVGNNGRLYTSTNQGLNWTVGASGTTENLHTVAYDRFNQKFWIGGAFESGDDCYLAYSTDGTTWTEVASDGLGPAQGAGDYIAGIEWAASTGYLAYSFWDNSAGIYRLAVSIDQFATFSSRTSGTSILIACDDSPAPFDPKWILSAASSMLEYDSATDPSPLTLYSGGEVITAVSLFSPPNAPNVVENWAFGGTATGRLITVKTNGGTSYIDDLNFGNAIRGFAHASNQNRAVCVGDSATIGYLDDSSLDVADAWNSVPNGFAPLSNVLCISYNESDGIFVACADNGQICRSSTGVS